MQCRAVTGCYQYRGGSPFAGCDGTLLLPRLCEGNLGPGSWEDRIFLLGERGRSPLYSRMQRSVALKAGERDGDRTDGRFPFTTWTWTGGILSCSFCR